MKAHQTFPYFKSSCTFASASGAPVILAAGLRVGVRVSGGERKGFLIARSWALAHRVSRAYLMDQSGLRGGGLEMSSYLRSGLMRVLRALPVVFRCNLMVYAGVDVSLCCVNSVGGSRGWMMNSENNFPSIFL
jgi:hypothetical protein